ncbi:MAG: zinc ribbon domain-containing protein [Gemmatimonadetes bacterium]|nr:zinc ribbon domain-containing protein [Gemmatimonadota bacterium]
MDARPVSSDRASGLEKRPGSSGLTSSAVPVSNPETCPECDASLPVREFLRFCPECGTNVLLSLCSQCGEALEGAWKYCVACGKPTGS